MDTKSAAKYYMFHQTLVDENVAMKHREIISENTVNVGGKSLMTLTFKQVLQDFGVRNWNGRVYTDDIVMRALDTNPLIQHDIKMHTWTGEYGHPLIEKGQNELARQMTIFPPYACWTIDEYHKDGNLLIGTCTTLAGGYGDMVRDRILTKYPAMASSRAIGGVDSSGKVLPGYTAITFDCVVRPSHKTAYMVNGSEAENTFGVGDKNTMAESASCIDISKDQSIKDFLLSESTSKSQINMLCDALRIDANTMTITENAINLTRMNEDGSMDTIVLPINQMVNAAYYNLFK